ncbi:Tim10/DDP family zinc finger-domain-containing protein [Phanerochaete sordida]|uniref:Mitochondrial import inner membrane translocase subunit n=1 Tax=Phanerochaete sordida TaxID=48140 RepID=A0A9P3G0I7_9APHY|nr:Tim10/DDP family zinc finger-domain-containing protein [Phanerochaete sordida]
MADQLPLDDATKKELQTFMENEQAQQRLNASIHSFTSMCWDKCITATPGNSFSRSESSCLANCVERFLDTSLYIVNRIEHQRVQSGAQ